MRLVSTVAAGLLIFSVALGFDAGADWNPPQTTVDKELVDVGRFLIKHGLGDPRGGKLAIAKVSLSDSWSQKAFDVKKLGWIKQEGGKTILIDLAGIAYPVKSAAVNVKAEDVVSEALRLEAAGKAHYCGPLSRLAGSFNFGPGQNEARFPELLSDQAVILLLISGETELAERIFARRTHYDFEDGKDVYDPGLGPFTGYTVLESFVSNYWVEAVHAHMRGDDQLALKMANTLVKNAGDYEEFGATLETGMAFEPDEKTGKKTMFAYIRPAKTLAEDSARRLKEGPKTVSIASLNKLPKKQRIAQLIKWLDQVSARQWGQPGGVNISGDPIVTALIDQGNAAGDPLLDCIDKDNRLTRSVSFGRDFFPGRHFITVKSAAFAAFCGITQIDAYGPNMRHEPTVAELRRMWAKAKNQTPAERWLSVLADDKSTSQQWVAAAGWLTEPKDVVHTGGWSTVPKTIKGKPVSKGRFTDLSPAKIAKLSNLLEARANLIEENNTEMSSVRTYNHEMAIEIAAAFYKVNSKRALPLLKDLVHRARADPIHRQRLGSDHNLNNSIYRAFGCLIDAKQPKAEEEYVQFVKACHSESFGISQLLGHFTKMNPAKADRYAKAILTAKGSGFNIEENIKKNTVLSIGEMLESPMPLYPSFRSIYAGLMSRKEVVGTIKLQKDKKTVDMKGEWGQSSSQVDGRTSLSEIAKAKCRLGDLFAFELASRRGAPRFEVYWSEARKDAAIKELCAYLRNHYDDIVKDARMMYQF